MRLQKAFVLVIGLSLFSFFFGGTWTYLLSRDRDREVHRNLELFTNVYDLIRKKYVEEPKDDVLIQGAIKGMLDALDPHSVYMTREEFAEMQQDTRGQFGGLGIEISKKDGFLTVVSPIEDTPAFKAGIKSGDVIVKIEDTFTDKLSIMEAVKLMRGKPGTPIQISVKREGQDQLLPFTLKRAIINVKSVTSRKADGIPVVKVRQFLERSADEMKKAIREFEKDAPLNGLILDLRNNPGGLLQQAIEVSDYFLAEGLIVYTQGRDKTDVDKKFAAKDSSKPSYPLVVLINGGSASASEIVAGAFQDLGRATIVGTQSFGKGSVQNVIPLSDGSGIKLTTQLYYTPKGRTIQGLGITPDRIVEPLDPIENMVKEKDLPGHLVGQEEHKAEELAKAKKEKAKIDRSKLTELEKEDYQLAQAVKILRELMTSASR
jgi:carboxyl-terminal processing protease